MAMKRKNYRTYGASIDPRYATVRNNTANSGMYVDAHEEAIAAYGTPPTWEEIQSFNDDLNEFAHEEGQRIAYSIPSVAKTTSDTINALEYSHSRIGGLSSLDHRIVDIIRNHRIIRFAILELQSSINTSFKTIDNFTTFLHCRVGATEDISQSATLRESTHVWNCVFLTPKEQSTNWEDQQAELQNRQTQAAAVPQPTKFIADPSEKMVHDEIDPIDDLLASKDDPERLDTLIEDYVVLIVTVDKSFTLLRWEITYD
jgi:hypothetical protein